MKKKLFALTAVVLAFSMLFAFAGCSKSDDEVTTTTVINVKTPLPNEITSSVDEEGNTITMTDYTPEQAAQNKVTIFEYFNLHINEVKGEKAAVKMSQDKNIGKATDDNGDSVKMSDNEYVNAAIGTLKKYMLKEDGAEIEYGESLVEFLPVKGETWVSKLTLDDVETITCVDQGYTRTITLTLKSPSLPATLEKAYDMGNVDDVMAEFKKAAGYMTVADPVLTYKDCQIILTSNIETDEVTAIAYVKRIDVASSLTGTGSLADMGTVPVTFRYENTVRYELDRTDPAAQAE